jgi:hypothetical protein
MLIKTYIDLGFRALKNPGLALDFIYRKVEDEFYAKLWFFLSPFFRWLAKKFKIRDLIRSGEIERVWYLRPGSGNMLGRAGSSEDSQDPNMHFPNLSNLAMDWLTQVLGASVKEFAFDSVQSSNQKETRVVLATFVSQTSGGPRKLLYLVRIFKLSIQLRRRGIPVIAFLPDTFYPDAAIVASALASITGGVTVFLQNTSSEAEAYGYANVLDSLFWTWPKSRLELVTAFMPWDERRDRAILPHTNTGGKVREIAVSKFKRDLKNGARYDSLITGGELAPVDYLKIMSESKICMTTNLVQDTFFRGSRKQQARVSKTATTGRVWEAFFTGVALVANETEVLLKMGFIPGVHYVSLDKLEKQESGLNIFSDQDLEKIAWMGFLKFRELTMAPVDLIPKNQT